ncbi:MAG: triphosphoribosyl-dephospho-CoA synthetase [Blastopirellula sp.]|nr:MAG: triphosphoribosyl-dephospho-CoA synthetase [Blastopirellula sp.]
MTESSNFISTSKLSTGQLATLACMLEVSAPKPGNVHRGADFENLTFQDFLASAIAIAPAMEAASKTSLGDTILRAVTATQDLVQTNTNLGIILLLAPLCSIPEDQELSAGIKKVLEQLTVEDTARVYEAIRLAQPGSMGKSDEMDIADSPPEDLLAAMKESADHDLVAKQYTNQFSIVLNEASVWLTEKNLDSLSLSQRIIHTHVRLMSGYPDSLIARKCGADLANMSAVLASRAIEAGEPFSEPYLLELSSLDFWLRSDNNRRNPGTTADIVTAGLFVALRQGHLSPPYR